MFCKPIMVVEDDTDIRRHVAEALELEGHTIYQAGNGQEAIDILCGLNPDKLPGCIVLDIMMPVMDGRQFLKLIDSKYKEQFGSIHIIVATAKGSPTGAAPLPREVERIRKPFELDELYSAVAKHCG